MKVGFCGCPMKKILGTHIFVYRIKIRLTYFGHVMKSIQLREESYAS